MKVPLFFIVLIFLFSGPGLSQMPEKKTFLIQAGGGVGFHYSLITDEEKRFVDNNDFKLMLSSTSNNQIDSVDLNYKKYMGYNSYIQVHYFLKTRISVGMIWQYTFINQTADLPPGIQRIKSCKLLSFEQAGPQLSYWFIYKNVLFSLSANPNYAYGKLTRIPIIYEKTKNFKTPDEKKFVEDFHAPVDVSGFGLGISAGLSFITHKGLLLNLRLRYDFSKLEIRDNVFVYPDMPNFHHIFLQAGLGFVTKAER